jgi:AcrR family transcriptional regulator
VSAAGSSIGTFYLYFKNKEDIFIDVLKSIEQELAAELNAAQSPAGTAAMQMQVALETLVGYLAARPGDARILFIEAPSLSGRIHVAWRAIVESHSRSVERALNAISPRVGLLDIPTAATCWVGSVTEAVLRWLAKPERARPSAQQLAQTIVQFNLNAIGVAATSQFGGTS